MEDRRGLEVFLSIFHPDLPSSARNNMALEFLPETLKTFEATVARYPQKEAAMLPVLYLAQREFGHLGPEAIEYVAKLMGQAPAR
ncbi:MAG: NAD(P)H-dependent oxidoreductase subunit E, partial [Candidatus Binatia bacterium]